MCSKERTEEAEDFPETSEKEVVMERDEDLPVRLEQGVENKRGREKPLP